MQMSNYPTYFELEAGGIAVRKKNNRLQFLTIFRTKLNDFTLPKGHVENFESLEEAAKREVLEETGYPVEIIDSIGSFEYKVQENKNGANVYIIRRVYYFECIVCGENLETENPDEAEGKTNKKWLDYKEALCELTYESDKKLLSDLWEKYEKNKEQSV